MSYMPIEAATSGTLSTMVMAPIRKKTIRAVAAQRLFEVFRYQVKIAAQKGIDRPQKTGANEGRGRFIDFERMLKGNAGISDSKNNHHRGQQDTSLRYKFFQAK